MGIKGIKIYLKEVRQELKKVTWPSRRELMASTLVVIIAVAVMALVLGVFDFSISRAMTILLRV